MGETRLSPRHLTLFTAEDSSNHRDGRVREDTVGLVLLARVPNSVRAPCALTTISDPARFKHVVYVDASTLSSIETDLQTWARELGDGHEHDTWEEAVRILSKVPENERWGLILDNADDPMLNLVPIIPKSKNLTVVITSRNRNLGNLSTAYHMELGEMERDEALTTLLHAARHQLPLSDEGLKSAHTILKELGCLAVALVQAGTYCHELSCSFTQYLALFYSHRAKLMKMAEPSSLDNYQRGAYTTLDLSYNALPQPSRDFLHLISFFHHTDIPLGALATATRQNFKDRFRFLPRPESHEPVLADLRRLLCTGADWDEMRVQDTLRTLRSFSLLSITSIDDSVFLQLHPLIQSWLKDMGPSRSQHYRAMTLQVLTTCCTDDAFSLHRYLLRHILDMLAQLKDRDIHINALMASGRILYGQGHYQVAAKLFSAALETMRKSTGSNKEKVMTISGWLAGVYRDQGRWNEAEKLQIEELEHSRRVLGMEHNHTIAAAGNLAVTYYAQGRWTEAEKLEVEVLEQRRKVQGIGHPHTITAAAQLGATYGAQGRWNDAEKLAVEVLEQRRKVQGIEHRHTIMAAANLAVVYRAQGRWSDAEKLDVEVLEQRRRVLGREHPLTIKAAVNLSTTYGKLGRWSDGAALLAPAVQLSLKVLGQQHPDTQSCLRYLMHVYEKLGKEREVQETKSLLIS
jgi:tetratricopeptide (TPR) repeat protein